MKKFSFNAGNISLTIAVLFTIRADVW